MKVPDNFLYYLSLHKGCKESHLIAAEGLTAQELEISSHREVVSQRKMVYAVLGEIHRMKAFVRLKALGPRVLYGFLRPRHRIGEHITDHFARRTPGIIVVLGNGIESWISLCQEGRLFRDHGKGLAESLDCLRSALDCPADGSEENDACTNNLWQVYYDSQYCPMRKNPIAFRRCMPRRDQNSAGLRVVQNKKGSTLDDFFDNF